MQTPLLDVGGLKKRYAGGDWILQGVSFAVQPGEAVALLGSNGSGKSTLLRCCVRLLEPSEGSVTVFGEDITHARGAQLRTLRSRVGFVFQQHNLVPRLSVLTNVLHGSLHRRGVRSWCQSIAVEEDRAEALRCLDKVGLAHLADRRADTLSGGQSQRAAIARAMMQRPKLIIADEPVASLDPVAAKDVMDLFTALLKEAGITLVFTSHAVDQALHYADRILGLKDGTVVLDEPSAGLTADRLAFVYE